MKQKKYFEKATFLVSGFFVLLLPLDSKFLPHLIAVLVVIGIIQFNKRRFLDNISLYKPYFICFVLLFVWQLVSLIWSNDVLRGLKTVEHRAFFIVAPLLFVLINKWKKKELIKIFIVSNFLICLYCYGDLIFFFINEKMYFIDKTIKNGITLETYRYISYHSGANFISFGVHRLYFSFSLLTSLLFLVFYSNIFRSKNLKYFVAFNFIFVIFLLQSKISILLLTVLILYTFYNKFKLSYRNKKITISVIFIAILSLGFYLTKIRFNQSIDQISSITENKEGSLIERFQYAKCSIELIRESPFIGYGIGDISNVVEEKLIKYNYKYLIERGVFDPHNEFLKSYLSMGIIGFLLFLGIFVSLFYISYKKKNTLLFFYVGFVFVVCLIEPFLSRQAGILPTLFFIGLIMDKEKHT